MVLTHVSDEVPHKNDFGGKKAPRISQQRGDWVPRAREFGGDRMPHAGNLGREETYPLTQTDYSYLVEEYMRQFGYSGSASDCRHFERNHPDGIRI